MTAIPYLVAYVTVVIFVIAVIARFVMWSRLPLHLRWELYPVAHEGKRANYGGSYLEETDWWKKPRERSLWGELKVMVPEIVFLVALYEHNRKMWYRSFPFHFGIYLVTGATFLMVLCGILGAAAPGAMEGGPGRALTRLAITLASSGLGLGMIGGLGLLHRRVTSPDLRDFTSPADKFNLVFFVVAFGCALVHMMSVDRDLSRSIFFVQNLITFNMAGFSGESVWMTTLSITLLGALLAYIPLTHMSHFVGKYFAYHAIRWNDDPNLRGSKYEPKIQKLLNQPISWAGPHIKGDGKKTWVDVATEEMKPEEKKK
jgi:nitrate reductase gamma subunit